MDSASSKNDHCSFCGDLGNEVNDDVLSKAFSRFPTFNMAKVKRDKWTGKTKGYGFASFSNPLDLAAALKRMNELDIVGLEVCWKSASKWQERNDDEALESDYSEGFRMVIGLWHDDITSTVGIN
ncbi:hypothetical protein HAX54_022007 [Datura stramonium]|uniref:RRM domain-containing protein n=1 Tax=Datura stramonium TaxID=4076 RepID=A0ABS8UTR4_DATST|nr:hypothetical protein [Datura stramonium]